MCAVSNMAVFCSFLTSCLLLLCQVSFATSSSYSSIDTLVTVCCAVVRPNLQYVSIAWNSVTLTEPSKIERAQKIFANLRYCIFSLTLAPSNMRKFWLGKTYLFFTLRRRHRDAVFLINVSVNTITWLPFSTPSAYCTL